MKLFFKLSTALCLSSFLLLVGCAQSSPIESIFYNQLWSDKPATQWEEGYPLGNGRLGIMSDGGIDKERIVLNEISMWSGSEANYNNPEAAVYLPRIRQLLLEGKNEEAQEVMYKHFVPSNPENGTYGTYQTLGNLEIEYQNQEEFSSYKRTLNLANAISDLRLEKERGYNQRAYFVSRDHDVIVIHLDSYRSDISFKATLSRNERATTYSTGESLVMEGTLNSGSSQAEGISFLTEMAVDVYEGSASITDEGIEVANSKSVTIYISAATNYKNPEYKEQVKDLLTKAMSKPVEKLAVQHIESYQELYNRASLSIKGKEMPEDETTDQLIRRFQQEDIPQLAALYYNYGRYLLISSTRPGSLPPNLQGLWADTYSTPWNGDYHLNINVQMNHWPVEQGNLSELHEPLIELTKGLVESGESSAKAFYGKDARGWVAHMMTNVWNFTAPGEHPSWGATNTGGAWLCAHLWEHYLFTGNKEYLQEVYPVLKGAADFFLSTMIEEPTHGWLVTAPTSSPENRFFVGDSPTPVSICMGPTMDNQLIRELYSNVIEAATILDIDKEYSQTLAQAISKLPPHQISKEGYLMEWLVDYKEAEPQHRHVSHLYGLHPGNQITLTQTPELAEACKETLNRRGDGGTGWSRAWKINFWARLGDGNRAHKLFKSLLAPAYEPETPDRRGGGTFPNLFCSHPPFQIDGNWGGTSGISEMLLQSHDGFIDFLPALPDSWQEGTFSGFRVRGGGTARLRWKDGKAVSARLAADSDHTFRIKMPQGVSSATVKGQRIKQKFDNCTYFDLELKAGELVKIKFKE